ncbi:MAG: aldehyde ferredoxin oxidoreductase C-terminal domain-containing protein [Minicystis sp.]
MPAGGYFGRYLRVDATTGAAAAILLEEHVLSAVVGGVGLGALLLLRETPPGFDPLGPEAAVVFAFGPLGGTPLTTSAKLAIVAKSPLTNRLNDALTSSDFALSGKRTGFDAIVITGAAPAPSVVLVDGGRVTLAPAADLWDRGLTLDEVDARLKERFRGFDFAVVGTAGERGVRYAGLGNGGRHAGRGGTGAVLGSKRIKAVGVRGFHKVPIADPERTVALAKDLARRSIGPATEKYRELGTVANLAVFNRLAALPTRNFQASTFADASALSGEELQRTRARGRGSCSSCTIGCEHFFEVAPGEGAVKAEYENVFAFGPLCGVGDPSVVLAAARACDALGMDTISAGGTIAFAMECAERGLFPPGPLADEARDLRFGDGARMLSLLDAIGHRRGALGDLLAEGSRRAAARIGGGAADFAPHVKGLEIPGYEPRALQTMALGFAVSARGADHNRSGAYEADFSGKVDRLAGGPEAVPHAVETEDRAAIMDSLVLCKFLRGALADFFGEAAAMLEAVTGAPRDAAAVRAAARRIVLIKRRFNEREGWTAAEDTLPARFFDAPLPDGAARGARLSRERLGAMIAAYHEARGLRADGTLPPEVVAAVEGLYRLSPTA